MGEKHIIPSDAFSCYPFRLIGKEGMLISSANGEGGKCGTDYNMMTASWGGLGVMWGKPVFSVFVRPERHTYGFLVRNRRLALSFFCEEYRDVLRLCGQTSGRDADKAKLCSLTPVFDTNENGRAVWFEEARLTITGKILYSSSLTKESVREDKVFAFYREGGYHVGFVAEIEQIREEKCEIDANSIEKE